MSEAIYAEFRLFAGSLAVGLGFMAVYDGLRIFRTFFPHGVFWTGMEDVLYWIGSGISTFLLLLEQNDGILRWYAVAGVFFGMLLYNATASRILLILLKKVEKWLTIKKKKRLQRAVKKQESRKKMAWNRMRKTEAASRRKAAQDKKTDWKNGETPDGKSAGKQKEER